MVKKKGITTLVNDYVYLQSKVEHKVVCRTKIYPNFDLPKLVQGRRKPILFRLCTLQYGFELPIMAVMRFICVFLPILNTQSCSTESLSVTTSCYDFGMQKMRILEIQIPAISPTHKFESVWWKKAFTLHTEMELDKLVAIR